MKVACFVAAIAFAEVRDFPNAGHYLEKAAPAIRVFYLLFVLDKGCASWEWELDFLRITFKKMTSF